MKTDLDGLMQAQNVDALLVSGPAKHNPAMVYMTGGANLTMGHVIKKRGEPAVLFFAPMERDEAARTGMVSRNYMTYPQFRAALQGDLDQHAAMLQAMLKDAGVTGGRLAFYGDVNAFRHYGIVARLLKLMPDLRVADSAEDDVILNAMSTKDEGEVARIRRMGQITTEVVRATADLLMSNRVKDEVLYQADGEPLTIGAVKRQIDVWLMERGAENPEGTIFAIGRDAGVPHSTGTESDVLRLGQTIVFDIFPCEAGGGYFHDFTRTWCLGHAPDEVVKLYEDVKTVNETLVAELEVGKPFFHYQKRTCELFEEMGHATVMSNPGTEDGYVHSLGHGVGLKVHELPMCSYQPNGGQTNVLTPGQVIAIEPGLYYPERGMGVRLENTYYITPDGKFENLAPYPMDLVLPVKR
ncbi:MAG: Xaa-Pro peptidase family protein [Anaerolineaceae bacterium]|jgi:Xaa-Pro aminopeptidase|nr:Xaa-Pro peptidase family protein [Anaerolineaceae bacterium]